MLDFTAISYQSTEILMLYINIKMRGVFILRSIAFTLIVVKAYDI